MTKLFDPKDIILDGRLDEAVWNEVPVHTGFVRLKNQGGEPVDIQTGFRILPCADRVYFGVRCDEPDMEQVIKSHPYRPTWGTDSVEMFISPSGRTFDYYQFLVSYGGTMVSNYYAEGGTIRPDPYAPVWKSAVHTGEDYWSFEAEFPLTVFYMTENDVWNTEWLINVTRARTSGSNVSFSTWSKLNGGFLEPDNFTPLGGMPMRTPSDAVRIASAAVEMKTDTGSGYAGIMTVKTANPEDGSFEFTSQYTESKIVELKEGLNEFTVPCVFPENGRYKVPMSLKRLSDGKLFERSYPVTAKYEPLKVRLSSPEYRGNFYPGQDYAKVVGFAETNTDKPITVTLEGSGIAKQTFTLTENGEFEFDTAGFEFGEAVLTASIDGYEKKQKIRRLAPSENRMSWISNGNLIVDGKPVLRRNMYAEYYHGGEAFKKKYDADDLHMTKEIKGQSGWIEPERLIKGIENKEAHNDGYPSAELFAEIDKTIEANRGRDFVYYYISDEPECRDISPIYLGHIYNYLCEKDPYHVVVMASRAAGKYVDCADWFETHPYLNPQQLENGQRVYDRPINMMGNFIDDIVKLGRSDKCIGFLPTCFSYKYSSNTSDYPTFRELVCHTWAAMVCGGKTLDPYAYHDLNDRASLYEGMRYVFSSFEALERFILCGERTLLRRDKEIEIAKYVCENGDTLLAIVNMTTDAQTVTADKPDDVRNEFRGCRTFDSCTFELKPLEVILVTNTDAGKGLPTYDEVSALIDRLENERINSGNLLFDKWRELDITASLRTSRYKLFDGVVDNYAWEDGRSEVKFIEVGLSRCPVKFTKLSVHGAHVDNTKLTLCVDGVWTDAEPISVDKAEFTTTFTFGKAISPEAFRMEFDTKRVELYEIEVFE